MNSVAGKSSSSANRRSSRIVAPEQSIRSGEPLRVAFIKMVKTEGGLRVALGHAGLGGICGWVASDGGHEELSRCLDLHVAVHRLPPDILPNSTTPIRWTIEASLAIAVALTP